jgi:SNF2 family DNA or RNA helicase
MADGFFKQTRHLNNAVVIVEESHNFVNGVISSSSNAIFLLKKILNSNCKVIMLSGTPLTNHSGELAIIVNLCKYMPHSSSLLNQEKFGLDGVDPNYIINRLFGVFLFSEGIKENYPDLLPVRVVECHYTDDERSR